MRDATKTTHTGTLGELMAEVELLRRDIYVQRMSPRFDYDLMTSNHHRIEVKTSKPCRTYKTVRGKKYTFIRWQFRNYDKSGIPIQLQKGRLRQCDYYIFICLDDENAYKWAYIVPSAAVGNALMINILDNEKNKFRQYKEAWELLSK